MMPRVRDFYSAVISTTDQNGLYISVGVWQKRVTRVTHLWLNRDKSVTFLPLHFAKMFSDQLGGTKLISKHFSRMWQRIKVTLLSRFSHSELHAFVRLRQLCSRTRTLQQSGTLSIPYKMLNKYWDTYARSFPMSLGSLEAISDGSDFFSSFITRVFAKLGRILQNGTTFLQNGNDFRKNIKIQILLIIILFLVQNK